MTSGHRLAILALLAVAGCGAFTDTAMRFAYAVEEQVGNLGESEGDTWEFDHRQPSHAGECDGAYKVQVDAVGMVVFWCKDAAGNTESGNTTSYHRRFTDTARTFIVEKQPGESLRIRLRREAGRAVIVSVR